MNLRPLLRLFVLPVLVVPYACASGRVIGPPIDMEKTTSVDVLEGLIKNRQQFQQINESDYRIGPGDVVTIYLKDKPDILGEAQNGTGGGFTITENPMLFLPYIGEMRVHGKTAVELQNDLKVAYDKFVKNPEPVVIIRTFQNNQIAVLGNVVSPGKYALDRNDVLQDAIFKAGGIGVFGRGQAVAAGRYLKIYREKVDRSVRASLSMDEMISRINEGNRLLPRDEYTVPIEDFLITGKLAYNIPLQPNDIIWVPSAGSVSVYGRVQNPGVVFLGPSLRTVAQVLTEVKGLRFGGASRIEVVRRNEQGERQTYAMNARRILNRREYDFLLADGDEIWVFNHSGRIALEFLGDMFNRGTRAGISATYNPVGVAHP